MGFNTTGNSQTSGRTTNAVSLGKLRTGQYQAVCDYEDGFIYTSNDYGQNFYKRPSSGQNYWWGFSMN